ncbi:mevalonate kinase [archaeon]|nr:mevalonate kinase [archaeon]MBT4858090.1 mevalonate kinase [archaeon]
MAKACGKIILFGEHAVVYNMPGIALPILNYFTNVTSYKSELFTCCNDRVLYDFEKEKLNKLIEFIFKELKLDQKIHLHIESSLPISSGLGSSASLSIALIRELHNFYNLNLTKKQINKLAYKCEKIFHGTPSGIDNTVINYEQPVFFQDKTNFIKLNKPLDFVIASTGNRPDTKEIVQEVRKKYEENKNKYQNIIEDIGLITVKAKKSLELGNLEKIGSLMNQNHELLKELGVSSAKLNLFCEICRQNGAYGAKLSGAGKGGNMIALVDGKTKEKIIEELSILSNNVFYTRVI